MIADSLQILFFFGLIGAFTNWLAWKRGFYRLLPSTSIDFPWWYLLGVFAIYLGMMMVAAQAILGALYTISNPSPPPAVLLTALQLFILIGTLVFLYLFSVSQGRGTFQKIVKAGPKPIYWDVGLGLLAWFISFPIVAVVGQFFDLLLYLFFQFENYEQVAVRYLKSALLSPSQLTVALFTILIAAPCIEEFLFRGCLQNFFKKNLGPKAAILLTSLCFAFFHFSPSQGLGNLSLLASLFTFALFLGFVYERQRSLAASIALHFTFNLATCIRILFYGES